jgi:hypothetical protein
MFDNQRKSHWGRESSPHFRRRIRTQLILQIARTNCRILPIGQYNGGRTKLSIRLMRTEEILRSAFSSRQMGPTKHDFRSGKKPIISENKNESSHYLHLTYFGSRRSRGTFLYISFNLFYFPTRRGIV